MGELLGYPWVQQCPHGLCGRARFFAELLNRLTDLYLTQLELCADIPADASMFGDDWGDQRGVLIGTERWLRYFKRRYARIYEAAHAQGKIVISHSCGITYDLLPYFLEMGVDTIQPVQANTKGNEDPTREYRTYPIDTDRIDRKLDDLNIQILWLDLLEEKGLDVISDDMA